MWLDIPRPEYPRASGSIICDLLVIGGGYTGLWTALHAAQRNPDRRIVLIGMSEVRDEVHSPPYLAGLYNPDNCAIVHPAKLAFELARACRDAGVQIFEHTNAQHVDSAGVALHVRAPDAAITCHNAVLA